MIPESIKLLDSYPSFEMFALKLLFGGVVMAAHPGGDFSPSPDL